MEKVLKLLNNKYTFIGIGVVALFYLLFGHQYSIVRQMNYSGNIQRLQDDLNYYKEENEKIRREKSNLFSNKEELERFAREKYFFKKDNEDIYIVAE